MWLLHQASTILLTPQSTHPIEKSYYSELFILLQGYLIPKQPEKLLELHLYAFQSELAVFLLLLPPGSYNEHRHEQTGNWTNGHSYPLLRATTLILFIRAAKLIRGLLTRIRRDLCLPWLNSLAEVSHQWRYLSWLSWLPWADKTKEQPKTQFKLQSQRSWTNIHMLGFGFWFFLSLDISEPFLFFYNSFGMYWPSKITTWESSGYGNQRQEQFTTSLTNLLSMFLWQILIFNTAYLLYRLKTPL